MWITREVFHKQNPGNSKLYAKNGINTVNKGENQPEGQTLPQEIVDNSHVDNAYPQNYTQNHTNSAHIVDNSTKNAVNDKYSPQNGENQVDKKELLASVASGLAEIKADLSTMEKRDEQRANPAFSAEKEQGGHPNQSGMWTTEKLFTMTVDKIYAMEKNPFKASNIVKRNMGRLLEADGEKMLLAMLVKLDFKCDGDVCEIRVMDRLLPILESNREKLEAYSSGFKIKLIPIETFKLSPQVEIDKIKKYFGEEYIKMVETLSK